MKIWSCQSILLLLWARLHLVLSKMQSIKHINKETASSHETWCTTYCLVFVEVEEWVPQKWVRLNWEGSWWMDFKFWRASNLKNRIFLKGSISEEDFMIHMLNNLPQEYDETLDGLKNSCTSSGPDALTI